MAQSALTVTPPNPTPPTNFGAGIANTPKAGFQTPPPNLDFAATVYNDPWHPGVTNVTHPSSNNPSGVTTSTVPPYLDDGTVSSNTAFAAPNSGAAAEGAGSEVVATQTYPAGVLNPAGPLVTVSCLGNYTNLAGGTSPNQQHASSLSPAANPTLTSVSAGGASGGGTATCTATGTGFTRQSVMYINGIAYPTTFVSSTSLTAVAPKKATAGSLPVVVITGGAVTTAPQNWTFT